MDSCGIVKGFEGDPKNMSSHTFHCVKLHATQQGETLRQSLLHLKLGLLDLLPIFPNHISSHLFPLCQRYPWKSSVLTVLTTSYNQTFTHLRHDTAQLTDMSFSSFTCQHQSNFQPWRCPDNHRDLRSSWAFTVVFLLHEYKRPSAKVPFLAHITHHIHITTFTSA